MASDATSLLGPPPPGRPFPDEEPRPERVVETVSVVTGRRIVAGLLDFVPMIAVAIAIGERNGASVSLQGMTFLWWLVAGIVYYGVAELLTGTSPGKAIVGLCVCDIDTTAPATKRQILIRTSLRFVDVIAGYLLGLVVALTSPKRQRLGDRAGRTVVLRRAEVASGPFPSASFIVLAALVVGTVVGSAVQFDRSRSALERLSNHDISTEVLPYANRVFMEGFDPLSAEAIRGHLVPGVIDDDELDAILEYVSTTAGEPTDDYEIATHGRTSYEIEPGQLVEVVEVLYQVTFEKSDGQLLLAITDVDGELRLIGFRFWA